MRGKLTSSIPVVGIVGAFALAGVVPPVGPGGSQSTGISYSASDSPIADAAMKGDVESVRSLLKQGADVNASQGDGMTALHWAATLGNVEMTEMLVHAGANPSAVTRLGAYTPLHVASKEGHGAVVRALLVAGADANASTTTGGVVPIHFAAASGDAESVVALLEHGAEPNARESQWLQTPLMFAAASNHVSAIEALLSNGADVGLTAKVVDISAREEADRTAQRLRSRRMAALRAASGGSRAQEQPSRTGRAAQPQRGAPSVPETGQPQLRGGTEIDPLSYADLVGSHGGLTALLLAAREGHVESALALLEAGADINQVSAGDHTSPILIATINGQFDLALLLLERGADVNLASDAGATPLYTVLNVEWIPKSRHPQPTASQQQQARYLEVMETFLKAGADPNVRLVKPLWYTTYNNDLLRVDRTGATAFWRAAYATDVAAMRLLVAYGADPSLPTTKVPQRRFGRGPSDEEDHSGLPPVPIGGPAVYPIHAASGAGYGQGFAANSHRHVPDGWLPAVRYLVEEQGADVNARDSNGYSPLHHAAARGDTEVIRYLVEMGADVTLVSRRGQTTVDMANGPVQRIQPFPETIALLESLGATNNHNCLSC